MSLRLLFTDELRGLYRSKIMIFLWVGLPALAILLYLLSPSTGSMSISAFVAILVGSIGGVLSAVMLVVSIVNEKERHVYDLFVIRPIRRMDIVLSKFLAVYICVSIAGLVAMAVGVGVDYGRLGELPEGTLQGLGEAAVMALSMIAITCSAGMLIGVFSPSVLVGVILVIYGGNQLSALALMPLLTGSENALFPLIPGAGISAVLLTLAVMVFNRKQL